MGVVVGAVVDFDGVIVLYVDVLDVDVAFIGGFECDFLGVCEGLYLVETNAGAIIWNLREGLVL